MEKNEMKNSSVPLKLFVILILVLLARNVAYGCTFAISPTSQSFDSTGGTGSVSVTSSASTCAWTATSNDPWITITSGSNGTGNGTVKYSVPANPGFALRTGSLAIAGLTFQITENRVTSVTVPPTYTLTKEWGDEGTGDGQFNYNYVGGVATGPDGSVFVVDGGNNRIQKFDSNGVFLTKWGSAGTGNGQFNHPSEVAVDSSGNVYVVDYGNNRIQKFDSNGVFLIKWGSAGIGNGQFNMPEGIAIDSSGNVYVAGDNRIQKFGSSGNFLYWWGMAGPADGQLNGPGALVIDESDNICAADQQGENYSRIRIQKFSPSGLFLSKWDFYAYCTLLGLNCVSPTGLAMDAHGNFFVSTLDNEGHSGSRQIFEFDINGVFIDAASDTFQSGGGFIGAWSAALDHAGNIYIVDPFFRGSIHTKYQQAKLVAKFAPVAAPFAIYRFNTGTGYLYTLSQQEINNVLKNYPQIVLEGIGFYAYANKQSGTLPVYRFNIAGKGYLYTMSEDEKNNILLNYPRYPLEKVAFYAYPESQPGTLPVYRFNTGVAYFYTISEDEKTYVLQNYPQFTLEGIVFYVYPQ